MGGAKPVALANGSTWPTQEGAKAHFKEMLNRYRVGQKISSARDHADLYSPLERYGALHETTGGSKIG